MMKKFIRAIALSLVLLMLASCGGPELLGIIPAHVGGTVTSTTYEFTKDDFYVIASYADGTDEVIDDYEFEVESLKEGYYRIHFYYKDQDNICHVKCEPLIYPSDIENAE